MNSIREQHSQQLASDAIACFLTHTHGAASTGAHTHTGTYTWWHSHTLAQTLVRTHTHWSMHTHWCAHTHIHTHTCIHTHTYTHTHTHTHTCIHVHTHTCTHTHTHGHGHSTHACMHHTHTHVRTHTLTHTHTFVIFALDHTKLPSCKLDHDLAFHRDWYVLWWGPGGVLWCSLQCGATVLWSAKWRSNAEYKKCVEYTSKQFTCLCAVFHPFFSFHL